MNTEKEIRLPAPTRDQLEAREKDAPLLALFQKAIRCGDVVPTGQHQWSERYGRFEPVYKFKTPVQ